MNERKIIFYLDRAKEVQGFKSDSQLDRALGFKGSMTSFLRAGKSGISPEKMHDLCVLGEIDPAVGLMDLAAWNSQGKAKKTYQDILQKIGMAIFTGAIITIFYSQNPANAAQIKPPPLSNTKSATVYYGK